MKKRLLTILLIFCMVLTMMPVGGVFADSADPLTYGYNDTDKTATVTGCDTNASGKITIPDKITVNEVEYTVTGIGYSAFYKCTDLTSIKIPESITSIGEYAFQSCSSLTGIEIPNNVTSIGKNAFSGCAELESIDFKTDSKLTSIGESAFYKCTSLEKITFNFTSKLESIGDNAFYMCKNLTSITIPDSVESIGKYAFQSCSSLTGIEIPNSVESIGEKAFLNCTGLTEINVDEKNEHYSSAEGVLFNKDKTTLIAYPTGKTGEYTIPDDVASIGVGAFYGCSGLTSIKIPNSVKSIGKYAFLDCSLTGITFEPDGVTSIGDYAFRNCVALTSITIPNSVKSIGEDAFTHCTGLREINVDEKNPNYSSADGVLFNEDKDNKKKTLIAYPAGKTGVYTIPNSVTSIEKKAFYMCRGLTSITIPTGVESIGNYAFCMCSGLTSITIPTGVDSIGNYAFNWCSSLTSITIPTSVKSIGVGAFLNCKSLTIAVIYGTGAHNTTITSKFPSGNDTKYIFFETKPEFGVNNITSNSVTLNEITGANDASNNPLTAQYRMKKDNIDINDGWQTEPIFEGLNPDTEYIFQVRFFVNENTEPAVYELAPVRTAKKTPSYTPPTNPTIDITGKEGGTVIYDRIKHTVTITPNDDYLVKEITLNGTTVPVTDGAMVLENIYGWSRISVTFEPKPEPVFEPDKYISELKLKANSSKTSKGNIRIKVTSVTDDNGNKIDLTELKDKGYTVKFKYYRSTKKASKYTAKVEKDADINSYINTSGKKGARYYYKVRVMVYDADGSLVAKSDLKQCSYATRTWSK